MENIRSLRPEYYYVGDITEYKGKSEKVMWSKKKGDLLQNYAGL